MRLTLNRCASKKFALNRLALPLLAAANGEDPEQLARLLQPVEAALADLPELLVSQNDAASLARGQTVLIRGRDAPIVSGPAYATSKAALASLTREMASDFGRLGIRVNAIRPGVTDTEIHAPGRLERITPLLPMGRPGTPEEIAEGILFLLSDRASYMTGSVLNVAGGR